MQWGKKDGSKSLLVWISRCAFFLFGLLLTLWMFSSRVDTMLLLCSVESSFRASVPAQLSYLQSRCLKLVFFMQNLLLYNQNKIGPLKQSEIKNVTRSALIFGRRRVKWIAWIIIRQEVNCNFLPDLLASLQRNKPLMERSAQNER